VPEVISIKDPDDPRVADYRQVRERDVVGRAGGFIAEGVVVLEKLIAAGRHPIRSVLAADKRLAALEPLLGKLGDEVRIYAAGQEVMDAIAGFHIHRGVLAAGTRAEPDLDEMLAGLPDRALVVGLAGIANHDNMGGLFRNAAAFGANAVAIDAGCCDPLYRKAIRVSVGAALTTPFARSGPPVDLVRRLQAANLEVLALSPGGEIDLSDLVPPARCAVLFGAEGPGLPDEVLGRARTVRIPMAGGFDSLNVATASGIVLHHLVAASQKPAISGA
jgi:tRNA G18 (ribose-2'-O)-methylase SpoU